MEKMKTFLKWVASFSARFWNQFLNEYHKLAIKLQAAWNLQDRDDLVMSNSAILGPFNFIPSFILNSVYKKLQICVVWVSWDIY